MKLWDLFRRHADVPDLPVPTPARRPDWPIMRPVQRAVSTPDLITAPDRFTGSLLSWRNPSRGGTLGHYVTPDAPAGVSDGLAAASPRGELPAPVRPWWWPRPPAVQRRVPLSTLVPEAAPVSSNDPAPAPPPAVLVYPLTGHTLVSAAGVEPPPPRLALPAVQRRAAEPEASQAPVADPDLPAGESPPEAPLPSVVAARTAPLPDASAGSAVSWPGNRPDLPAARRLGLGAPLQRVPDAAGGPSADSATVQRQAEVDVEPMDVAPLVSDSAPMASVVASSIPSAAVEAVDTSPHPDSGPVWSPSAEPAAATPLPTAATPTGAVPFTVQRQIETEAEVESIDVAPLVSNSPSMASVVIFSAAVSSTESAAGSHSTGPSPSPQSVQHPVDTPLQPGSGPMRSPSPEQAAATPTGAGPSPVQRRIETETGVESIDVAPLVSGTPPIASVVMSPTPSGPMVTPSPTSPLMGKPAAGPGSAEPGPSTGSPSRSTVPGLAVQRAVDTPLQCESTDMPTPSIAAPALLSDMDHTDARRTVTYDSVAPAVVVGLVGNRPIEPVVTDYAAAPAAGQTRWSAVQRRSTVEGQVRAARASGPRMLVTTAVQRNAGGGANPASQWPPDALAVNRSSPGVGQQASPTQLVQFAAAAPVAAGSSPPELNTEPVVQRADDQPAAATGAAAGTSPVLPVGSNSPTEVDTLVRRLYDPIVRRLKAELQLDRERAGHSLDLRH